MWVAVLKCLEGKLCVVVVNWMTSKLLTLILLQEE